MKMTHSLTAAVVAVAGLCLTAGHADAQGATPSPFHAGQWGIEAFATGNTGGVLRFITPRTAIVFDVSASHSSDKTTETSLVTGDFAKSSTNDLDVSLGLRRHAMAAPQLAVTYGIGLLAGTSQRRSEYAFTGSRSEHLNHLGGYADIGGQYMVTDRFAAGLSYRLRLQHNSGDFPDQAGNSMSVSFVPLRATLYF